MFNMAKLKFDDIFENKRFAEDPELFKKFLLEQRKETSEPVVPPSIIELQKILDKSRIDKGAQLTMDEAKLIDEFKEYVDSTYGQHYAKDKFQATEFIVDGGHGMGFCIGNVMKYAQRYGKKGTHEDARKDLLKVLHYALIGLYVHDTMDEQE